MVKAARILSSALAIVLVLAVSGCAGGPSGGSSGASGSEGSSSSAESAASQAAQSAQATAADLGLAPGEYTAKFNTDSTMFHVNEANDGEGVLTVADDGATIHVSLVSKKIVNLYPGTAEEASLEGAQLLEPTTDTVTYSDGYEEEVYGFDIPVPVLDEEFDVAILGESGRWFDHKVSVTDPVAE